MNVEIEKLILSSRIRSLDSAIEIAVFEHVDEHRARCLVRRGTRQYVLEIESASSPFKLLAAEHEMLLIAGAKPKVPNMSHEVEYFESFEGYTMMLRNNIIGHTPGDQPFIGDIESHRRQLYRSLQGLHFRGIAGVNVRKEIVRIGSKHDTSKLISLAGSRVFLRPDNDSDFRSLSMKDYRDVDAMLNAYYKSK